MFYHTILLTVGFNEHHYFTFTKLVRNNVDNKQEHHKVHEFRGSEPLFITD